MSARAMRKLQGDALLLGSKGGGDSDEEDDSSEDDIVPQKARSKFAILPSDIESSDEEDDEEEEVAQTEKYSSNCEGQAKDPDPQSSKNVNEDDNNSLKPKPAIVSSTKQEDSEKEEEEDLDAILNEFKEKDVIGAEKYVSGFVAGEQGLFRVILINLDVRELDVDWTMRNALTSEDGISGSFRPRGRNAKTFWFGSGGEGSRQHRPTNYLGGGMGMKSYEDDESRNHSIIPWPYAETTVPGDWYKFLHADSYVRDVEDYRYIQQAGDLNSLLFFVAHHPFVTDALLQLATVLYQANQSQQGMTFLRRCLFVYECASLVRFHSNLMGRGCLMDHEIPENRVFFEALRHLIHVSSIAGLWRTCLAVSRYVLALDPLRDPLNVLAVMDSYAVCCHSDAADRWIIALVESGVVRVMVGMDGNKLAHECELRHMPNWAYSYALALFRVYGSEDEKTSTAMQHAIRSFPSMVGLLLQTLEVDITGRSVRRDWITVLDKLTARDLRLRNSYLSGEIDTIEATAALQALDNLISIYVKLCSKVWGDDEVLQLLYDSVSLIVNVTQDENQVMPPLQPAVMRYTRVRYADWETRIQQLPEDANIVDPGLVAQAMVIEPNRPRLLRRMQGQGAPRMEQMMNNGRPAPRQPILGGPPTGLIDPDLPVVELFWRSFLPWNHVEGVRRDPG